MAQPFQKKVKEITEAYTLTLADLSYAIRCNSTSPFTVTLPTASGFPNFHVDLINIGAGAVTCNGLTLLQGNGLQLYCNGSAWTNMKLLNEVKVADVPAMTSAEFATKISDETGTGLVVFSTTPTLSFPQIDAIQFDTTYYPAAHEEGMVHWNEDSKCIEFGEPNGGSLQVGQEQRLRAKNDQGATIYNGQVVYVSGASGANADVKLADADSYFESVRALAVATEDIGSGQIGRFTTFGFVHGLDTSAWADGTLLFLSATPGIMTDIPPVYPANRVAIGTVTRSHATEGEFGVKITYIPRKFGDIDNGHFTGFEDDGTMVFNGDATVWNDLPPNPIIRSRLAAANNPTLSPFVGNIEQYTFDVNDYIYDNFEVTHEYKEGSDLLLHAHWATNGLDTTDRYVKWEFEYSIANRNNGATMVFSATPTIVSTEFLIPANTPSLTHYSNTVGTITGTDVKIGAVIVYRFRRIASTGTAPTNNPFGIQTGCHIEHDTCGSRLLSTK